MDLNGGDLEIDSVVLIIKFSSFLDDCKREFIEARGLQEIVKVMASSQVKISNVFLLVPMERLPSVHSVNR